MDKLRSIPRGRHAATDYQQHVRAILELLFAPAELRKFRLEEKVFGNIKRLDIVANNKARRGFFYSLKADHDFKCPTIVIECKNYKYSLNNPEFDQLGSRLGKKLGYCGILAFRRGRKRDKIVERCRTFFDNEEKIIIPLSDLDLIELLRLHQQGDRKKVEDYLDDLLFQIKAG